MSDHRTQLRKASKSGVIMEPSMQPSFERLRKESPSCNPSLKGFEKSNHYATQLQKASKRVTIMQPSFKRLRKQSLSHQEEGEVEEKEEEEEEEDDVSEKGVPMCLSCALLSIFSHPPMFSSMFSPIPVAPSLCARLRVAVSWAPLKGPLHIIPYITYRRVLQAYC